METIDEGSTGLDRYRRLIGAARRQFEASVSSAGRAVLSQSQAVPPPAELPGYELIEELHRGGQGVVYRACQRSTGRTVAIKVMREGPFSGPRERARFEREVYILAQINHPNIVGIVDSGTVAGNAYFVMDYVAGVPLDQYVTSQLPIADFRLPIRFERPSWPRQPIGNRKSEIDNRLRLFVKVCDAVHAAHLHGVIHRDLKPRNILVDESGEPRILDFGLAKLDAGGGGGGGEADMTMTATGHFIGSLPWASPEQAAGAAGQIDIRTDVYSLGVMLYRALAGRFPYSVVGSIRDVMDRIATAPPARLVGAVLGRDGRRQRPLLRVDDELETIVLKCLAKEPERRYQGAGELARDLRHYLAGEPIEAKRDSGWYLLKKSLHRHRLPVGVAAGIVLLLAVFAVAMTAARARAEREGHKARQVLAFLQGMLAEVDPDNIGPGELTVREVLDHTAHRLKTELGDQPEVAASVHQTLGNHYRALGLYHEADRHLRRAVEVRRSLTAGDDRELADALSDLAANLQEKRDLSEAEAPTREALEMRRRLSGRHSLEAAESLHDLAAICIELGRPHEGEPLARESLDIRRRRLGAEHADVALSTGMLGYALMGLGRLDEAETALRAAVEMVRRLPGDQELMLAGRLTFLSGVLRAKGSSVEEEQVVREAVGIRARRLAPDHPALGWSLHCLARVCRRLGKLEEAETTGRRALEIYMQKRGPEHGDIAECQELLAQILDDQGRFAEAETLWSACLEMRRTLLPSGHPELAIAENGLLNNRAAQHGLAGMPDNTAEP